MEKINKNRCLSCMKESDEEYEVCPYCGAIKIQGAKEPIDLTPGTLLWDRYIIGCELGSGGFGIIYKAFDVKLETIVAVKEFFSPRLMTRAAGTSKVIVNSKGRAEFEYRKDRFLEEARYMAKFSNHHSIPNVLEFFESNGTAYIVMELLTGESLSEFCRSNKSVDPEFAKNIITQVGEALSTLHKEGIIHRDVAPDNIFICDDDSLRIKLLDLGAAKLSDGDDTVVDVILKPGYSPLEQYDRSGQIGPWSDIYALGATYYFLLTGKKPAEATNRKMEDTLVAPCEINSQISENLSNSIMKALALDKSYRFKNVSDFLKAINGEKKVVSLKKEKRKRRINHILSFAGAAFVVLLGVFLTLGILSPKETVLKPASITVWYCAEENSTEERAMDFVTADFQSEHEGVSIELRRFSESEYIPALSEAYESDTLPDLFESSGVDEKIMDKSADLQSVITKAKKNGCTLFSQFDNYYQDTKKVPVGMDIPVILVITAGEHSISFDGNVFSAIGEFGNNQIAIDTEMSDKLRTNVSEWNIPASELSDDDFFGEKAKCGLFFTSAEKINSYKDKLMGYEWHPVYCSGPSYCEFVYEWSIAGSAKEKLAASKELLFQMLGKKYQSALMLSYSKLGEIPVNDDSFLEFCSSSSDYQGLTEIKTGLIFQK